MNVNNRAVFCILSQSRFDCTAYRNTDRVKVEVNVSDRSSCSPLKKSEIIIELI